MQFCVLYKSRFSTFLLSDILVVCLFVHNKEIKTYCYCRYRRKRDQLVERSSAARIPTMWGPFTSYCYKSLLDGIEHIAMVKVSISCVYNIVSVELPIFCNTL